MIKGKVKYSNLMYICMLTGLILSVSVTFNVFSFLQPVAYALLASCFLSFIVLSVMLIRKPVISFFDLTVIIYTFLLLTFTVINTTDLKSAVYRTVELLLLLLIFNQCNSLKLILKTTAIVFSACVYLNLLIMILFPDWMFVAQDTFDSHLLGGNYNQMGCRLICALIVNIVCVHYSRKWIINVVALTIVSIITLALVGSMTSLACIIIFTFFCLVPSTRLQKIMLVSFFAVYLMFQSVIVFNEGDLHNNPYAVYIIEDVLDKDITFTNRTSMWDASSKAIAKSPIIGYGIVDRDWYISFMSSEAIGPHNFIYNVFINGGIILFMVLLSSCWLAFRKVMTCFDKLAVYMLMGFSTMLFMMTMEVYPFIFVFLLLYIMYNYPRLKKETCFTNIQK